jgi:hypothetical protein
MIFIIGAIVISQFFATGGVSAIGSGSFVFQTVICHTHPLV